MVVSEQIATEILDAWNAEVPDGSSVIVNVHGTQVRTKTRGKAVLINGQPKAMLLGVSGAVDLELITLSPYRRWVKLNRRGRENHFIECDFESKEAMETQLNEMMRLEPRIESYETRSTRPLDA